jgi:hypothetical protein
MARTRRSIAVVYLFLASVAILLIGSGAASAQISIGGEREGGSREEGRHGDRHDGVGVGIGIGIEIGRTIIENPEQQKRRGDTTQTKSPKRAAKKDGKDTPGAGKPPVTTTKDGDNKNKEKKKADDPKDKPKADEPKDVGIDDCIVILQYGKDKDGNPRIPTKEQDPTSAQNEDIKGSAELVKKNSPNAQVGTVTDAKGASLDEVIKSFKAKGCCKRIQIFGHGTDTGQLQLPYEIGDQVGASDKLGGVPKANMHGDNSDAWDRFTGALKDALCKDPKGKPGTDAQVKINACWSGRTEDDRTPIASELAKEGIRTSGWTGVVDFDNGEKAITPQGHDADSKQKAFQPPSSGK